MAAGIDLKGSLVTWLHPKNNVYFWLTTFFINYYKYRQLYLMCTDLASVIKSLVLLNDDETCM